MRVLLTSSSYPRDAFDWRGRFIAEMVSSLAGHSVLQLEVWVPPGTLPPNVRSIATREETAWLARLMEDGGIAHVLSQRRLLALGRIMGLLRRLHAAYRRSDADVVHVNWLQNALPLFGTTKTTALITVLGSDLALLRLPGMISALRRVLRTRRCLLAPNAEWMVKTLDRHFGDIAEILPIPFGIDAAWFNVKRRPPTAPPYAWLAVTRVTSAKLGPLLEWGRHVFGREHQLHLFGPLQDPEIRLPAWLYYHGPTHPRVLLDQWVPHAAGLITLSQHTEGRPQILLEAMAAGLPVIASPLPAHLDMIRHGETGMLVDDPSALKCALDWLAEPARNAVIGANARRQVESAPGRWEDCGLRYLAAYQHLIGKQA
ncbi:MAG: glycosyltransferase family 4 protein [Methylophilaceae bacterium]|nr:glycosyltransferase family 4 protein [Methylophilaceae bacterium]